MFDINNNQNKLAVYIETYGCQMNVNDTEIISAVLAESGCSIVQDAKSADVVFLNTCSVRENAESRIYKRLDNLRHHKKRNPSLIVGILGCMAERLKSKLLEDDFVSLIAGPDEYRKLPELIEKSSEGERGIAVRLSRVETYDDIEPLRCDGISAWLSIMRGCNNFCSFCVVPYTRGRERSRPLSSLISEIERLRVRGFKEITLLGQNVNSYFDETSKSRFPDLLRASAKAAPDIRFRFTTSHPKDLSDSLIEVIAEYINVCNYIHLPVQSGSNRILDNMRRGYSAEHYLERINAIRKAIPDCALTTDIIAGYPSETEEDHLLTIELMKAARYDGAFMFKYSPRENTKAFKEADDVPEEVKNRRLNEIIFLQQSIAEEKNRAEHGKIHETLVEGESKRKGGQMTGRTDTNKVVVFQTSNGEIKQGDLVNLLIERSTSATLFGRLVK